MRDLPPADNPPVAHCCRGSLMHAPISAGDELLAEPSAAPAVELPLLRLRRDEDRRLSAGHLWVFSNEVDVAATPLTNGGKRLISAGGVQPSTEGRVSNKLR